MPSAPSCSHGGLMAAPDVRAFRASVLHFRDDPGVASPADSFEYLEDGLLVVEDGRVARHCPERLRDTPESVRRAVRELIERWDGQGRLHYAITPRFAVTSSEAQLRLAGELALAYPNVFVHSPLAEHLDEVAWVRRLFPSC